MGLSRLDNFLKSSRGTILYVNPNDLDSTDSIENQGNSLTRPFKTIQRALIEAARFSYQRGLNNDRFGKTTILIYPGEHTVDNRPGYIPDGINNYRTRAGAITNDLPPYDLTSNLSLDSPDNELYKLNSIHGGVIVPRGTSLVGLDLRKTKIRPKYVPDPENDNIERSALFRITGACYFWQFTMFDADPNGVCYKDYTKNQFVPNFSHHKLTCFEYADGSNGVEINDTFQQYSTTRTDLDMYYEKVSLVYGQSSGRAISPDYPSSGLDIQAKIDEFRIVGSTGATVGITSIKAGDGVTSDTTITVTTATAVTGLEVDTPFRVSGITADSSIYNGQFVVSEKVSSTEIKYTVQNTPNNALPSVTGSSLQLQSDTVTSASPYIFNTSLRSVFGMCGMHADGSKATGFKSMVVAQFTGIGLQKDDKAFVKYNSDTGIYEDNTVSGNEILSTDSRAVYKPSYRNFHVKCSNNSVIQAVSIFAIGFSEHFVSESGGDQSITNSNSNFGAKALIADGFRKDAFTQDDVGYITHIIPPKEVSLTESAIEFDAIDVLKTLPSGYSSVGVGSTGNLYLYGRTNKDVPPENVLDGFRIGARTNDELKVLVSSAGSVTEYKARIVMPNSQSSAEKVFAVNRSATGINSIGTFSAGGADNVITLTADHTFLEGETVRVISDTGQLPDGLDANTVYHVRTSGLAANNIKLAKTFQDSLAGTNLLDINEKGGILKVVSRVTDKNAGDLGHPIQYDGTNGQWYVKVSTAASDNTLYPIVVGFGSTGFGVSTPRTFFNRKSDSRNANDTLYRMRYVVPASSGGTVARPPVEGFVLQESNTSIGSTNAEIQTYFGSGSISNINQQRNFRFIADATYSNGTASFVTELPHDLTVGSKVQIVNVTSANNTTGAGNSGFNYTADVTGISSAKMFTLGIGTDPGAFSNDTATRTVDLPYFKKKEYDDTLYVYRTQEVQEYRTGDQDGIYYLTVVTANEKPTVSPFNNEKYSQPVKSLFPQIQRDDPESDPDASRCFARSSLIGDIVINDPKKSITKEAANRYLKTNDVGVGITEIKSFGTAGTAHTVNTTIDHGLNRIVTLGITSAGAGYGAADSTFYNATLVGTGYSDVGKHATAKITTGSSGEITAITVMDGGSAYGIGNSMFVTGISTFAGFSSAIVTVDSIYNNVGDTVRISGVNSEGFIDYNQLYRITGIPVGGATSITVSSASSVGNYTETGIGATNATGSFLQLTGEAIGISSLTFDRVSGLGTVATSNRHGLSVDQKITISGATGAGADVYNGSFVVTEIVGTGGTGFTINLGVSTYAPEVAGTLFGFRDSLSSNGGVITIDNENLNGRMTPTYAGITTTLSAAVVNATTDEVNLTNIDKLDVRIGDFLMINDELVRVKTTVSGNPINVFRGVLGTRPTAHSLNDVVRRVKANPIELRRHSINRASGHTFEYVGFGPGNYSTALPDRHDRSISAEEELLAQSLKRQGGINFYTGMNDRGISYSGNKKLSTITGREEIFDTPFQTVEGEDISVLPSLNVINPVEAVIARSIRVEGGSDNKVSSQFNGPIIVNNKLTVNSTKGLESNNIFLQGDATISRKYTVGIATPGLAGNPGDLVYNANPTDGGYVGWIYSVQNDWRRFGAISLQTDANVMIFDRVGVGTTGPGEATFKVGAGTTQLSVDGDGVGIGTTADSRKFRVLGESLFHGNIAAGIITGTVLHGDGSNLTNINVSAAGWTNTGAVLYNTNLTSVGIGTSVSSVNLTVGDVHENTGAGRSTTLLVHGQGTFAGILTTRDAIVVGVLTASGYDLDNSTTGRINAGIVTVGTLNVGTGGTIITSTNSVGVGSIGINSTAPQATLDVDGHTFFKTYSERVKYLDISANVVTVDLSEAQTFICTATSDITQFTLTNAPIQATSFSIRVEQDSTGSRSVGIDTFKTTGGVDIPVYWPGNVVPQVTTTASRADIYSFKLFDGANPTTSGLYGVVGGQNFQN
ncbi:tail fiber protein [Synechococcus phage S-SM2]|uniref:Fiber n=1 Tax=Synechococcus phage S-SM2 TaxID=444860 RepID=E3SIS4_9CAUD|nr:tail fiber protein [Synechococcus phage S-SM2]ADO97372.1 fiber [Synechococcus phage S-SM2]